MSVTKLSDLPALQKMRLGVRHWEKVEMGDRVFFFRPLTQAEITRITNQVISEFSAYPVEQRTRIVENTLLVKKTLVLASREYESNDPGYITPGMLEHMTPQEVSFLYDRYLDICDEASPDFESLSEEQVSKLIEEVKKNKISLKDLSFGKLVTLCWSLLTSQDNRHQDK